MKKYILYLIIYNLFLISTLFSNDDDNNIFGISKISKTYIKIGEKINLKIKIKNQNNAKLSIDEINKRANILWEEIKVTDNKAEIYSTKDYHKDKYLILEINFTFFTSGEYNDFNFKIPMDNSSGKIIYINSENYKITVENPLTQQEILNLKTIKDPTKIELKKEKEQARIPFKYSFYILFFLFIIILVILGIFIYYFLIKFLKKKLKGEDINKIPPYQKFLIAISKIYFDEKDDRKTIEKKLSLLTEVLKELIYEDFSFNAPCETTRELIQSLRNNHIENTIILSINSLFNEIDMVKFAKAEINLDKLKYYIESIKDIGNNIHNYKILLNKSQEDLKLNQNNTVKNQ